MRNVAHSEDLALATGVTAKELADQQMQADWALPTRNIG